MFCTFLYSLLSSTLIFNVLLLDSSDMVGKLCILPAATSVNWVVNINNEKAPWQKKPKKAVQHHKWTLPAVTYGIGSPSLYTQRSFGLGDTLLPERYTEPCWKHQSPQGRVRAPSRLSASYWPAETHLDLMIARCELVDISCITCDPRLTSRMGDWWLVNCTCSLPLFKNEHFCLCSRGRVNECG